MKLNARQIETAKPAEKDYKLPDGNGLFLLVKTTGAKYWRYRYTFAGKEKMLAVNVYPAISLSAARQKRDEAKQNVAVGVDPVKAKNYGGSATAPRTVTFKDISQGWHEFKKTRWSDGYQKDILEAFRKDVYPVVGNMPLAEIEPSTMLEALRSKIAVRRRKPVKPGVGTVKFFATLSLQARQNITPSEN